VTFFLEVNNNYKLSKAELATARAENDEASIAFYELACKNVEDELKVLCLGFFITTVV
jgi:hypothetical protein